jgi:phospholipid/cholesterol/gamma-HCH transport system ATP-binding protein
VRFKRSNIILTPVKNEEKVPVIEIKGLVKSFGENNHVLKGVSLSLNRGRFGDLRQVWFR